MNNAANTKLTQLRGRLARLERELNTLNTKYSHPPLCVVREIHKLTVRIDSVDRLIEKWEGMYA